MKNKKLGFILSLTLISLVVNAQIATFGIEYLPKVKSGTTYVTMNDPNSERAKEYKEVFANNWTISKPVFIKYSDVGQYLKPGNSFLTITMYTENLQMVTRLSDGGVHNGVKSQKKYFQLEFWMPNDKFFESKKSVDEFGYGDKNKIAYVEIASEFAATNNEDNNFKTDYNLDEHLKNWGPGILKNYIQSFNRYFKDNTICKPYDAVANMLELSKLKTETLYVPDYVLTKTNIFSGDESKQLKEKDIFGDYKLKYKLLTLSELNKKIQTETIPFYYLLFIRSSNHKYINVVNSITGEIVYNLHQVGVYNMKSDDLEELQKKIDSK